MNNSDNSSAERIDTDHSHVNHSDNLHEGQLSNSLSRRKLLGGAVGVGAAAAAATLTHALPAAARAGGGALPTGSANNHITEQDPHARTAVIVGSGFGGSVAALRLAQAGYRVIVIERGRRWSTADDGTVFPPVMAPDKRAAWFSRHPNINQLTRILPIEPYPGLVDRIFGRGIEAVFGAGVGGGSLVFGSFCPQPRRQEWEQIFPKSVSYSDMDHVWFPKAKKELGVSPLPEDLLAAPQWKGARAWIDTVHDAGLSLHRHDFAINWDRVREELSGRRTPSVSVGEYVYGSNSGAKLSLDRTYLARAEATGRCTVESLTEVIDITENSADTRRAGHKQYQVTGRVIDEHGTELRQQQYSADLVVMAAGSFYTPALLGRLRVQGRLPRLPEAVGKNYGTNGDFLIAQTLHHRDFGFPQGGPGVGVIYDDAAEHPYTMSWEAAPMPPLASNTTTTNLVQVMTSERGSIDIDPRTGAATLVYPHPYGNTETDRRGRAAAGRFSWLAAGRYGNPVSEFPIDTRLADFGSGCTWHSLGGMVMDGAVAHGEAPGAADAIGRVHGYDNLLVVDGSLLPGTAGMVNPALTITAIAERCLHEFLHHA